MKIVHWIPAFGWKVSVDIWMQTGLDQAFCDKNGHDIARISHHSIDLEALRNRIVRQCMRNGVDYLLMQDADNAVLGTSALKETLEDIQATDAAMVGVLVPMRKQNAEAANVWPVKVGEVYECEKIGSGILLIDIAKLREWGCSCEYDEKREEAIAKSGNPSTCPSCEKYCGPFFASVWDASRTHKLMGMDIFFSHLLRGEAKPFKSSQKIVCDARLPVAHMDGTHRLFYDGKTPGLVGLNEVQPNGG
jgi:hypothetical protein